ncbi:MAG: 1-acyl-sn-glycerol-3-phosphate acyltransferase [Rhodospirillales bacterium]|nr:1-acyl-sn-glycerol-3-phosphate acyltransferase [Rhodospirillales bacterium]
MLFIRSVLMTFCIYGWSVIVVLAMLPLLLFPRGAMVKAFTLWMKSLMWIMKVTMGITYEVRGMENLPKETVIFASKHQSTWDTLFFYTLIDDPAYVLKKELLSIPFYGWYLKKTKLISVDRNAGASALKQVIRDTNYALDHERSVVIFPEGTRSIPGEKSTYQPGIAAMYKSATHPVVPVALNSGLYWGRRDFIKRPGKIIAEILPPLGKGMKAREFMSELERIIEEASTKLNEEAGFLKG